MGQMCPISKNFLKAGTLVAGSLKKPVKQVCAVSVCPWTAMERYYIHVIDEEIDVYIYNI